MRLAASCGKVAVPGGLSGVGGLSLLVVEKSAVGHVGGVPGVVPDPVSSWEVEASARARMSPISFAWSVTGESEPLRRNLDSRHSTPSPGCRWVRREPQALRPQRSIQLHLGRKIMAMCGGRFLGAAGRARPSIVAPDSARRPPAHPTPALVV
jgi:hypothetical protein